MKSVSLKINTTGNSFTEKMEENPWVGLSSYQDPEKSEQVLKFCGREEESFDVTQLITNNILVTLYGKSGIGKTSLLNAGVFPRLRTKRFLPINIRLSMDAMGMTFQQCIIMKINQSIADKGILKEVDVVPMPSDEQQPEYLWSYFARTKLENKDGCSLFPVLVFDQFEEVLHSRKKETEALLRQICYLMDESHALTNRMVDDVYYKYDFNFRFVISIREDELYRLEDCIDNNYLSEMKRCRFRLRNLTKQAARDVILIPGSELIDKTNKQDIVDKIIDIAWNNYDDSVNTNMLSLLCYRIYIHYRRLKYTTISVELVERFVSGNPIGDFYKEVIMGLSEKEKFYIEDHFVDNMGRRDSVPESEFEINVKNGKRLLWGTTKILQRIAVSSDVNNCRIELIHDSFCTPLIERKQNRMQRKRILQLMLFIVILFLICIGSIWIINGMNYRHQKMLENESRFIAEKVQELIKDGDSYLARILAIKVLPKNQQNPERPYTSEAEAALRNAYNVESAILRGHEGFVTDISMHPKNNLLVSSSYDKTLRIWDTLTGDILDTLYSHTDIVNSVNFSSDGKYLVSASKDKTIKIWDAETYTVYKTLYENSGEVNYADFSKNGDFIAFASKNMIKVWKYKTNEISETFEGHTDKINNLCISIDGTYIISASKDKTIKIWHIGDNQNVETLYGHADEVNHVCLSKDGKLLLSASNDKTIKVWDWTSRKMLYSINMHSMVTSASFSEDGKHIVSSLWDNALKIWDLENCCLIDSLYGHKSIITKSFFRSDGKCIVSSSWDNTLRIWDFTKKNAGNIIGKRTYPVSSIAYSGIRGDSLVSSEGNNIYIWDLKEELLIDSIKGHKSDVRTVTFSPDGKRIISSSWDKSIKVWDAATFTEIASLIGHRDYVESAFYSPDGKRIISSSWDKSIKIWDAATFTEIDSLIGHKDFVLFATYSPNGEMIASCSKDSTIIIWDSQNFKILDILKEHTGPVTALSFSSDGKYLSSISNDNNIRIWNMNGIMENCNLLKGHTDEVTFSSFSADGKYLVSASKDNTIKVWNIERGEILYSIDGHVDDVNAAIFAPDNKSIISVSKDKTLRIWEYPSIQSLIDKTYERFKTRPLSKEDKKRFYIN